MAIAGLGGDTGLVITKLAAPPPPPGVVDRGGLLTELLAGTWVPAVLVTAPAGSGKTVLLAQAWQRLVDQPDAPRLAWLSLDERDDDPRAFWAYVRTSITRALAAPAREAGDETGDETRDETRDEIGDGAESDPAGALIGLLADAGTPVVLMLDDFHAITDEQIHRAVGRLIGLAPEGVTVVLASRSSPPLPLTRWRLAGRLRELTGADLAFTSADAARLLRDNLNIAVNDDQVTALVERTQGWAAGLRVAGLSLQRAADRARFIATFSGDHHELVSYLGSEVLDRLPGHLRGFLVRTAVLRVLTAGACDAVLDRTGSAADLEQLARAGLFVTAMDDAWSAYAVHPLFRDALLARLRTTEPGAEASLHRRAADWYLGQGEIGEAVENLLAAGETGRVRQLLVEHQIPLSNRGRHGSVWHWLGRLPVAELEADPALCLMAAWTRLNERDYAGTDVWLRRSGKHPDDADATALPETAAGPPAADPAAAEAGTIWSHVRRHLGDVDGALRAARAGAAAAPPDDLMRRAMAGSALGVALYWTGQTEQAIARLREARRLGQSEAEESSVVLALMYEAASLARDAGAPGGGDGPPDNAIAELAGAALRLSAGLEDFHVPAMAHLALASSALAGHRLREALSELDEADRWAERGREPLQCVSIGALRARALHRLGETPRARAELRTAQRLLAEQPDPGIAAAEVYQAAQELRFAPRQPDRASFPLQPLTARELTLLGLLDSPLTREEIAAQLYVSLATVKTHLHSIARKLGVSDRRDIVARARTAGLLPPAGGPAADSGRPDSGRPDGGHPDGTGPG